MTEKQEKTLPPRKPAPCQPAYAYLETRKAGKPPQYYDALPRDCKFAYLTPGYYATGFRISDVYKTEVDFSEYRNLLFFEDSKQADKWGLLKSRIPYPEGRITDLPGTRYGTKYLNRQVVVFTNREVHYRNYCLRSLTAESASSWRKSIRKLDPIPDFRFEEKEEDEEKKPEFENEAECLQE